MGDNYIGNNEVGWECHGKKMTMERNLKAAGLSELKNQWYEAMASIGIGRLVILYGRALPVN